GGLDVVDAEADLHVGHLHPADVAAALQGAHVPLAGGAGLVEAGRPPRRERPAEGLLVEALGARHVVSVDREMAQDGGHGGSSCPKARPQTPRRACASLTTYVANAPSSE